MRSALVARKSVYIFVYIMKFVLYLISNHIFVCINHKDMFKSNIKWCAQRIIKFTDEKLKPKVQIKDGFFYIMNLSVSPHFNSVFDLQINNSGTFVISGKITSLHKVIKYEIQSKTYAKCYFKFLAFYNVILTICPRNQRVLKNILK